MLMPVALSCVFRRMSGDIRRLVRSQNQLDELECVVVTGGRIGRGDGASLGPAHAALSRGEVSAIQSGWSMGGHSLK
jgi:hypothetical protein